MLYNAVFILIFFLFGWVQSKIKITKLTGDIASFLMAVLWGWWLLSKGDFFTGDLVESCFNAELEWSLMLAFSFTGFDELNKIYVEAELRIQNWTIILLDCSEHTQWCYLYYLHNTNRYSVKVLSNIGEAIIMIVYRPKTPFLKNRVVFYIIR